MDTLGFVGGTGAHGRGLALRLAQAGVRCLVGSRDADKARRAEARLRTLDADLDVAGVTNAEACAAADAVFVVVPYRAQAKTLPALAEPIGTKIVVCCVNALAFDDLGPYPLPVTAGSAAEECRGLLPRARVVAAFHNVSAQSLLDPSAPLELDVLVVGDDEDAREDVASLARRIPGVRPVDAGPLRLAAPVEQMTAVLLSVNRRYRTHAGLRLTGLER